MSNLLVNDATGLVENILQDDLPGQWSLAGYTVRQGTAKVGQKWNGTTFITPALPVPNELSRRQFIIGMATEGYITGAQAVALASTGTIPAPFLAVINQLPSDQQDAAKVTILTATSFYKDNLLVQAGLTVVGATQAQLDAFFTKYSQI